MGHSLKVVANFPPRTIMTNNLFLPWQSCPTICSLFQDVLSVGHGRQHHHDLLLPNPCQLVHQRGCVVWRTVTLTNTAGTKPNSRTHNSLTLLGVRQWTFLKTLLVGLISIPQVLLLLASYSLYLHFSGLYFLSRSSASTWCIGQYISQFLTPQSTTWSTWTLINMIKRTEPRQLSEYNKQTSFQLITIGEIELLTWGCLAWIAPNCEW